MKLEVYRLGKNRQFNVEEQALMVCSTKYSIAEVRRTKKRDHIPIELGFAATLLGGTVSECPFTGKTPAMPFPFSRKRGFMYRHNISEMGDLTGPTTDCSECGFESDSVDIGPIELRHRPHPTGKETIITPAQLSTPFPSEDIGWQTDQFIEDDLPGRLILAFGSFLRPVITEELLHAQFPGCEILSAGKEYGVAAIPDEPSEDDYLDLLGKRPMRSTFV